MATFKDPVSVLNEGIHKILTEAGRSNVGINRDGIISFAEMLDYLNRTLQDHTDIEADEAETVRYILILCHGGGIGFLGEQFTRYVYTTLPKDDSDLEHDLEEARAFLRKFHKKYLHESRLCRLNPAPTLEEEIARADAALVESLQTVQQCVKETRKRTRKLLEYLFSLPTAKTKPGSPKKKPEHWYVNNAAMMLYIFLRKRRNDWSKRKLHLLIYDLLESWLPPLDDPSDSAKASAIRKRIERAMRYVYFRPTNAESMANEQGSLWYRVTKDYDWSEHGNEVMRRGWIGKEGGQRAVNRLMML